MKYSTLVRCTVILDLAIQVDAGSEKEARALATEQATDIIDNCDTEKMDLSTMEAVKTRIASIREGD
jgi:hypothetical protein